MKKSIKKSLQSLLIVPVLAFGASMVMPVLLPAGAHAQGQVDPEGASSGGSSTGGASGGIRGGTDSARGRDQPTTLFGGNGEGIFETIVNTLLFIIGAVAVIMLIYGGFRYVTSGGDSGAVTSAKNTILYAVIGIVVALLAYAILNFVVSSLGV